MRTTGSTSRMRATAKAVRWPRWRASGGSRRDSDSSAGSGTGGRNRRCRKIFTIDHRPLFLCPPGLPSLRERLRKVGRRLRDNLMRIAPDHLTLARRCDCAHRQATFLEQPRAVARAADRFAGLGIEPANAPDRIAPLEVTCDAARNRQMLRKPFELV